MLRLALPEGGYKGTRAAPLNAGRPLHFKRSTQAKVPVKDACKWRQGRWGGVNYRITEQLIDWWIHNCLWVNRLLNWRSDAVKVSNWNGVQGGDRQISVHTISATLASTQQPEDYFTPITDTQNTDTLLCGFRCSLLFLCHKLPFNDAKKEIAFGACHVSRTFSMEARSAVCWPTGSTTCSTRFNDVTT